MGNEDCRAGGLILNLFLVNSVGKTSFHFGQLSLAQARYTTHRAGDRTYVCAQGNGAGLSSVCYAARDLTLTGRYYTDGACTPLSIWTRSYFYNCGPGHLRTRLRCVSTSTSLPCTEQVSGPCIRRQVAQSQCAAARGDDEHTLCDTMCYS